MVGAMREKTYRLYWAEWVPLACCSLVLQQLVQQLLLSRTTQRILFVRTAS